MKRQVGLTFHWSTRNYKVSTQRCGINYCSKFESSGAWGLCRLPCRPFHKNRFVIRKVHSSAILHSIGTSFRVFVQTCTRTRSQYIVRVTLKWKVRQSLNAMRRTFSIPRDHVCRVTKKQKQKTSHFVRFTVTGTRVTQPHPFSFSFLLEIFGVKNY